MPTFLDADTADAICTLIFIGYINNPANAGKVNIQFADAKDRVGYDTVATLMNKLHIATNFTQSAPPGTFAFIAALGPKDPTASLAKQYLNSNDTLAYLGKITTAANSGLDGKGPYGAYIGGAVDPSKMTIIGPSKLDSFLLKYRSPDTNGQAYYDSFLKNSNIAIDVINKTAPPLNTSIKITTSPVPPVNLVRQVLPAGYTVKSYHGMIQAMATFKSFTNSLVFEIALGNQTTKVSSCFPCTLFMEASNSPASSTHLGKGDYWNIPVDAIPANVQSWAQKIFDYYTAGKNIAKGNGITKIDAAIAKLPAELENKSDLANVFLEALTFPNSFTTKIANTFSATRTDPPVPTV